MKISMGFVLVAVACATAGCAALPEPPIKDGIRVQDIVDAVQCGRDLTSKIGWPA